MEIKVEATSERIDSYLSKVTDYSRTKIAKAIKDGFILVNETVISSSYKVKEGDVINLSIPEENVDIIPEKMNLDIIYEDDFLAVINKASGVVVHPAVGNYSHTLVNGLMYHFNEISKKKSIRPGIVHRLDKDTSGLMIVAKDDKTHELLSEMIKNREIDRHYLALVWGIVSHDRGRIEAPIGRDINDRQKYAVTDLNGKDSITNFRVLERLKEVTLIECKLETGRTHQIRVHMNYIGHPIVNDPVYGKRKIINSFGQMLHSYSLKFIHPITKEALSFKQEPPQEFLEIINMFREVSN